MKFALSLMVVAMATAATVARSEDVVGRPVAAWQQRMLDIHQISTGRGNAGLYIFPDGTTLLVDAGELPGQSPKHTPARPDGTRGAGEWVVRYLRHALRHDPQPALDYVLLTHFHEDHMGEAAILDHHGYLDAMNESLVAALRARVWTISVWDAHHPTPSVWERLQSERPYPGARDIFATDVHPDARLAIKGIDRMASGHGHILLRVPPGGGEYRVAIVDDTSESHTVIKSVDPTGRASPAYL